MTAITINESTIAKLESKGFKRWTKKSMDRMYLNADTLGLEYDCYKTGNIRKATWRGERISNADARRLLGSKIYIDLADGELHVRTEFWDSDAQLEDIAREYVESIDLS